MEIIRGFQKLGASYKHSVVTIGNFDGVHLGHQEILRRALEKAKVRGGVAIAYTFRPHPQQALRPETALTLLSTYDEKLELLDKAGIQIVVEEPFSREFSTIAPDEFFNDILLRRLNAEALVVGYDFAFGKERAGHLQAIEELCQKSGVELEVVQPQRAAGEVVSSTRIRQHLQAGDIEAANRLLGREFSYQGLVSRGEGRGRKIGFPTANLQLETKFAVPYGVYATWARIGDQLFPSVTNVGIRPTFGGLPALVETHVLDYSGDLYGTRLEIRFVRRLREERKFSGIDELKAQIARDAEQARAVLSSTPSR